jgi:hypothetical protein
MTASKTSAQPTPGPWRLDEFGNVSTENKVGRRYLLIAQLNKAGLLAGQSYANGKLIASAPTLKAENERLREALELVRPHVDLGQACLNGSYCAAKIDEHTFCGRGREWPGHRSDAKEWPEHEFIDGSPLVAALATGEGVRK